jgi:hypothetical protein
VIRQSVRRCLADERDALPEKKAQTRQQWKNFIRHQIWEIDLCAVFVNPFLAYGCF